MPRLSQASSSSQQHSQSHQLDEATLEKLSGQVGAFLLTRPDRKVPVKRAEIVKMALGEHGKSYDAVINRLERNLKGMGVMVVRLDQPAKAVMLVNTLRDMFLYTEQTSQEKAEGVLLMLVLSFIFMKNGCVRDDALWDYLMKLGIITDNTHFVHDYFGDARKLVSKTFVRRMYLECVKAANSDPVYWEFSLGRRAHVEVPKRNLLKFVCEMYGSEDLDLFPSHLQLVEKSEQQEGVVGVDAGEEEEDTPSQRRRRRRGGGLPISGSSSQGGAGGDSSCSSSRQPKRTSSSSGSSSQPSDPEYSNRRRRRE